MLSGRMCFHSWCTSVSATLAPKLGMTANINDHGERDLLLPQVIIDFSLTVKAASLIFISARGSAISSAKEGKSGFIYNLLKS